MSESFIRKLHEASAGDKVINSLEILIIVFALFGNLFILILWIWCKKLRVKRNSFLISLSIANILTSLFAIPLSILAHHGIPNDLNWCLFEISTVLSIRAAVNFAVVGIAIDRLLAVTAPFEYRKSTSHTKSRIIIVTFWIIAFTFGYFSIFAQNGEFDGYCHIYKVIGDKQLLTYSIIGKILPAVSLIVIYVFILCAVKRVTQNMKKFANSTKIKDQKRKKAQKKELRATCRVTAIVATFVVCEIPSAISNILCATDILSYQSRIHQVTLTLAYFHSAICPFVYAFNLRDFQYACQKLLGKKDLPNSSFSNRLRALRRSETTNSPWSSESDEEFEDEEENLDNFNEIQENKERT